MPSPTAIVCGDYYGMGMMPAGSGTVGFLWQFRHSLPRKHLSDYGVFGVNDVTLVYQAGRGERWEHVPGRPDFISHAAPSFGKRHRIYLLLPGHGRR